MSTFDRLGISLGWFLCLVCLTGQACPAHGQSDFAVGSVIRGFELPKRGQDGAMQFKVAGDRAIIMTPNRTEVHDLRIDIYKEGRVNLTVRSPKSDYWRLENRLTTDHGVEIVWPGLTVTAKSMEWNLYQSQGTLRDGVRVVIDNLHAAK